MAVFVKIIVFFDYISDRFCPLPFILPRYMSYRKLQLVTIYFNKKSLRIGTKKRFALKLLEQSSPVPGKGVGSGGKKPTQTKNFPQEEG